MNVFLEYAQDKTKILNVIDNKGLSPLCKLSKQPESEDNFKKITLALKNQATCSMSLPDFHPLYMALNAKNTRVVRALFKHSDAVHCLANYSPPDPFLHALAKCNNDQIFDECLTEWVKWIRTKDPHSSRYLDINLKNRDNLNILHVIAINSSIS